MGTRKREALLVFSVNRYQLLGVPVARRTENFYECIIALFRPHRRRVFLLIIGVLLLLAAFFFYPPITRF